MRSRAQLISGRNPPSRMGKSCASVATLSAMAMALLWCVDFSAHAQDSPHLSFIQPGGMPGRPVMTGIQRVTNGVAVSWYGPPGYYQLFQKIGIKPGAWQAVGGIT